MKLPEELKKAMRLQALKEVNPTDNWYWSNDCNNTFHKALFTCLNKKYTSGSICGNVYIHFKKRNLLQKRAIAVFNRYFKYISNKINTSWIETDRAFYCGDLSETIYQKNTFTGKTNTINGKQYIFS
jgi:hypothetical protein